MLLKLLIASFVGAALCEIFDSDLYPLALVARAIRGSPRRRQRPGIPFPMHPARTRFPRLPGLVTTDVVRPPGVVADPADISYMLVGQCSKDNPMNLARMFQDMFVSNSQADAMVQEAKTNLRNSKSKNRRKNSFIESERMSKIIGRVNSNPGNSRGNSNPGNSPGNSNLGSGNSNPGSGNSNSGIGKCCETEMRITAPFTVLESGKRMQVVHMNSSYQFVHEGLCVNPRAKCQKYGECVQVYKYAYMLLYDPEMMRMYPPVRFGRVQVKSHCECMNIGV